MHSTVSESRTSIPCTDSGSGAVIPTQKEPRADSENDSEPGAANEPSAINRSRTMIPSTVSKPRAMNLYSNAERIDPKRDLQITSDSNRQQSMNLRNRSSLCPGRIPRPTFKVRENQLITEILQQSIDPRNRHALLVLMSQCTEDADPEEPTTLEEALSSLNRTQWLSATRAEVHSLRTKGVYRLVDRSPKMKVLGGKWVFKLKRDQDRNIIKYKARYVVKGYMQCFGVDYTNTYANVADIDTI